MPSVNDIVKDKALEQSIELQRLEAGTKKKVVKKIQALEKKLIAQFLKADLFSSQKKQVIQARLKALFKETEAFIKKSYDGISLEQAGLLTALAKLIEKQSVNNINKALNTKYTKPKLSKNELKEISQVLIEGATSTELWTRRGDAFNNKFKDTVRDGISKRLTGTEIVRILEGNKTFKKRNGAFAGNYRSADLMVRTSIHSVANKAREATFENNNDIILGIEWVSTLDARTTNICKVLDGLIWDINTKEPIGHDKSYPGSSAHWGCRSAQVPVIKKYNPSMKKIDEKTRASMDGQVSAKLDYEDWLKTKPTDFQKKTLGPKRYELWNDGKIDFMDLTDQNNQPLRLDQLKV
jgi:hypothetical protein